MQPAIVWMQMFLFFFCCWNLAPHPLPRACQGDSTEWIHSKGSGQRLLLGWTFPELGSAAGSMHQKISNFCSCSGLCFIQITAIHTLSILVYQSVNLIFVWTLYLSAKIQSGGRPRASREFYDYLVLLNLGFTAHCVEMCELHGSCGFYNVDRCQNKRMLCEYHKWLLLQLFWLCHSVVLKRETWLFRGNIINTEARVTTEHVTIKWKFLSKYTTFIEAILHHLHYSLIQRPVYWFSVKPISCQGLALTCRHLWSAPATGILISGSMSLFEHSSLSTLLWGAKITLRPNFSSGTPPSTMYEKSKKLAFEMQTKRLLLAQ